MANATWHGLLPSVSEIFWYVIQVIDLSRKKEQEREDKNGKFKMFSSKQMWRHQETIRMKCIYSFLIFDFDCWRQTMPTTNKNISTAKQNKEKRRRRWWRGGGKKPPTFFLSVEPYFRCFFSNFDFYSLQIKQFDRNAVAVDVLIVVTVLKFMLHKRIFSNDCVLCKYLFSTAPNRISMC